MSSSASTTTTATDEQLFSHYVHRKIRENGGGVPVDQITYGVSDVADISAADARDMLDQGENSGMFTIQRPSGEINKVTAASTVGVEPQVITEYFGPLDIDGADFVMLDGVDRTIEEILHTAGIETFSDLADADPTAVAEIINEGLDARAVPADFSSLTGLTDSEVQAIEAEGVVTNRDLAQAEPAELAANASSATLQEAKIRQAQQQIADHVEIYEPDDVQAIMKAAEVELPAGPAIAARQIEKHEARKARLGGTVGAVVSSTTEETDMVGEPLAVVRDDLDPEDSEANYVSDIGHNEDNPVNTGLPILEDVGYSKVPKKETDPDAGPGALPVDENGEVIPPAVPLERDLQLPIDELLAKKLGRNVPVRIVGPRGSGKNYVTKYLCYMTNRGYRSIDADRGTMPQDLFGPISPDENGKLVPKNADLKQGLLNGDTIVINEFPVMTAGAAMSLHQLLNENKIVIKSHGQEVEPHPQARIVVTMNPPTREYRDSEPMNSATRGRFRGFWQGYPDDVDEEVRILDDQVNTRRTVVEEDTLKRIVEFAHRTRRDDRTNWPTLSVRNLTIVCEHIADGAAPRAAVKNMLRMTAEPNQRPEDAFDALGDVL